MRNGRIKQNACEIAVSLAQYDHSQMPKADLSALPILSAEHIKSVMEAENSFDQQLGTTDVHNEEWSYPRPP